MKRFVYLAPSRPHMAQKVAQARRCSRHSSEAVCLPNSTFRFALLTFKLVGAVMKENDFDTCQDRRRWPTQITVGE